MRVLSWVVTVFLVALAPAWAQDSGRLTVVGHGSFEAAPDMATITMGVTAEARTAAAALASNSADTAKVLAVIKSAGVAPRDVQTSGLSLSPLWNNRSSGSNKRPAIVGYSVSNQVTVRVRALADLGRLLDAVVSDGATQFHGLSFGLQDPVPAADNARTAAVHDAARKAQLYADAAGVSLGHILEISETGGRAPQPMQMREMAMADAVPIAQGEVSIGVTVTIIYEISH